MSYAGDVYESSHRNCDKCGWPVPPHNDRMVLDAIRYDDPSIMGRYYARHLLPVLDSDGEQICEGSPSIAQYLEGQPRDTRGYRYLPERELIIRKIYADIQREYSPQEGGGS